MPGPDKFPEKRKKFEKGEDFWRILIIGCWILGDTLFIASGATQKKMGLNDEKYVNTQRPYYLGNLI